MAIQNVKEVAIRTLSRGGLLASKYSPQILFGLGLAGVVTSTVLACKATLKVDEILEKSQGDIDKVRKAEETLDPEVYTKQMYQKDLAVAYGRRGLDMAKLYGPAALIGVAGVSCLLGSHIVLSKRNIAVVAAYKLIEESYAKYRDRVTAELGPDKDRMFRYGINQETVTETTVDADGKKVKQKVVVETCDPNGVSEYARFFDEFSRNWQKNAELNLVFLKAQQNFANDLLKAQGHLFLNEVYDMLGMPRSKAGSVVGWVVNSREGDNFVDFGIYNPYNSAGRDFVNGYERSILLDFNVDGVIYDLI